MHVVFGNLEEVVIHHLRQIFRHYSDVAEEPHIEHAVGLVRYQSFDPGEVDGISFGVIEQPPRRRNDDIDPAVPV